MDIPVFMRFAVAPCVNKSLLSSGGSEKKKWLKTQCFAQYALIVFRRVLDAA